MTRRVRLQLTIFVVITLIGIAYVGANYARVDRLVGLDGYSVTVEMSESGGIFSGADVTYRGVSIGRVKNMWLTNDGVNLEVRIDNDAPRVPKDTDVVVANKSAVGEQYLDFQPVGDSGPYLKADTTVPRDRVRVPLDTRTLLTNVTNMLSSVDPEDLSTVIAELGTAFEGSAKDLRTILDSSSSFFATADEKYEITASLIRNSESVLKTQVDSSADIKAFAANLRDLSTSLRTSDADLRTVLETGAPTAATLRAVLAENEDDFASLLEGAITTNQAFAANLKGVRGVLMIAPYGVESAFSIIAKDSRTGQYSLRMSLAMQPEGSLCLKGYKSASQRRTPFDRTPAEWNKAFQCAAKQARGVSAASGGTSKASMPADSSVVLGTYDMATNDLDLGASATPLPEAPDLGKDSWKWMLLGPTVSR
ncbi:MCE family protein [Mumia zhuanghuii]|uniref:MCE family protein n=1 Tax=Mumia zhuanghuii TaxID=2585211 RepID=A0A5C4MJ45_9ACTN|nr:MCE family protein [Mumia zhuanghuii]TNC24728.1 MCE family protein [Mumia zhuanghuii]TNC45207.1 MCE family protein [Mumia zhuanghuii]